MAKLGGVACIILLMCMALAVPHAEAITCGDVATAISSCLGYVTKGGEVPSACCNGIKGLNAAAKTTADRRTTCSCLKAIAGSINGIQYGLVSGLPSKCGVRVPYPISPNTDCSKVN